eukprot:6188135-Pleurochrysis_carterae.AAC.6
MPGTALAKRSRPTALTTSQDLQGKKHSNRRTELINRVPMKSPLGAGVAALPSRKGYLEWSAVAALLRCAAQQAPSAPPRSMQHAV